MSIDYEPKTTAQGVLTEEKKETSSSCGSACGAGDDSKVEKTPTACGTGCGASDEETPKKEEEKSSACGTGCGAGE